MPYALADRLVIGVASSALFDLTESDAVFRDDGPEVYEQYQHDHLHVALSPGVAFPFIRRLLSLNDLSDAGDPLVEVIVMSRNSPTTGLRVMRSVATHGLAISRAIFSSGQAPFEYAHALNVSLFLSADAANVRTASSVGVPAGQVFPREYDDDADDPQLRIAFDFDGVLADDEIDQIYESDGLVAFEQHETANAQIPHGGGPLLPFLQGISRIQHRERICAQSQPDYVPRLRVAIVTARSAPAHERAILTLQHWNVSIDDIFLLGGISKSAIIEVLKPHIFFDDQDTHLVGTTIHAPSVHIPFGVRNLP